MKHNGIKVLQITTIGLQLFALILTIFLTVFKATTIRLFGMPTFFANIKVIPIDSLLNITLILLIYLIGFVVISLTKVNLTKTKSVILIAMLCIFEIVLSYSVRYIVQIVAMRGSDYLTAYSSMSSAISTVTTPFRLAALILFCVSCGGYYGMESRQQYTKVM